MTPRCAPAARIARCRRGSATRRSPTSSAAAAVSAPAGSAGPFTTTGAADPFEALRTESQRRGLPWTVVAAGCTGMCWAAPVVQALRDGKPPVAAGPITAESVPRFLHALSAAMQREFTVTADWASPQRRILMERCGVADPYDIADALRHGAYETLARVLEDGRPEAVIDEVRAAGLTGRGGAYFQTALKWSACRAAAGATIVLATSPFEIEGDASQIAGKRVLAIEDGPTLPGGS